MRDRRVASVHDSRAFLFFCRSATTSTTPLWRPLACPTTSRWVCVVWVQRNHASCSHFGRVAQDPRVRRLLLEAMQVLASFRQVVRCRGGGSTSAVGAHVGSVRSCCVPTSPGLVATQCVHLVCTTSSRSCTFTWRALTTRARWTRTRCWPTTTRLQWKPSSTWYDARTRRVSPGVLG